MLYGLQPASVCVGFISVLVTCLQKQQWCSFNVFFIKKKIMYGSIGINPHNNWLPLNVWFIGSDMGQHAF